MSICANLALVTNTVESAHASTVDRQLAAYVLALEDKRFMIHPGVDPLALGRAFGRYLIGRPNGGASTIDMQLVRTITNRREQSWRRKLSEILIALFIRQRFGADRILTAYFELAYTGAGLTGIEAAAQALFRLPVAGCQPHEKALLAALLISPAPAMPSSTWWLS